MIRFLTLILSEMKRKLWEVNHAQAAYRRLRPLSVLPMNWADLAGPDPQEDPLVESQENQESNDELNCRQVEDNDIDAVDDSGELKGTVPTDDYTDPQGTVPVDDDDAAELQKENDFSELEATAAHLRRATLVEGELRKFLENHWKDIQYWTDVIQSHMRTVHEKSKPFEWAQGKMHEWRCDAELVYTLDRSPIEQTRLYVGSFASALKVEQIPDEICRAVTMNADDSHVSRDTDDWGLGTTFCKAQHSQLLFLEVGMKQKSTGIMNGTADRWVLKIVDFFIIWQDMVTRVNEHEVYFRALYPDRLSYSALVHCYGGVHRSEAGDACLVMWMEQVSLQEALAQSRLFHSGIVVLSTCICSTSCFQAHKHLAVVSFSLEVFATRCHLASLGWWALCQLLQLNGASILQCALQCNLSGGIGDTCLSLTPVGDLKTWLGRQTNAFPCETIQFQ